jgi:hypothetical protein
MVEDRLRVLKMRVPQPGLRIKLIPTEEELEDCRALGRSIALHLMGRATEKPAIELAELG